MPRMRTGRNGASSRKRFAKGCRTTSMNCCLPADNNFHLEILGGTDPTPKIAFETDALTTACRAGPWRSRARSRLPRRRALEPVGLERRDVVGEPGCELEHQLGIAEVGIGPDLRHAPPVVGPTEEAADHGVRAELSTPPALRSEQAGDHRLVLRFVRVLAVETDLESKSGRLRDVLAPDDLRLIVLARRLVRAKPDLHAIAVVRAAQLAQVLPHETTNGVRHVLEE